MLAPRSSPPRAGRWWAVLALAAAVLTGCAQVSGTAKTVQALNRLGVERPGLNVGTTNGVTSVKVDYQSQQADEGAYRAELERVQRIVWTELPFRFDVLDVQAAAPRLQDGQAGTSVRATRAQLQAAFGPRPARLDQSAGRSVLLVLAVVGLVLLLLAAAVILVIVLVVRRGRANRPSPGAAGWGQPPPGQGR